MRASGSWSIREATVGGLPARVCRVSFSGELAYEVNVPSWHGLALWEAVSEAGQPYGITPYGTETMHVLRAEKGYVIVGQDTDGTVTPQDLGLGWMIAKDKGDFVGRRSHERADTEAGGPQAARRPPPHRAAAGGRPARGRPGRAGARPDGRVRHLEL